MEPQGIKRKLTTILAADVVGYSRLMSVDEEATLKTLSAYRQIIDGWIARHDGRLFGSAGDSVLAEFGSAVEAVRCAVEIQKEVANCNADLPDDRRMRYRIGVNLGDVMVEGENLLGDGVNVAARLEGLAEPGGICISGDVYRQVRGKLEVGFDDMGEQQVKNIAEPVHVYRVLTDGAALSEPTVPREPVEFPPLPDRPSIAVLPFTNMSGDPEQDYFSDGMTEDIITEISKISGLLVISRNSTFTYKGKAIKAQDVCRDLGVRYIMEGSVRKAGARVRITAQLIDGRSGGHVWAERYDRELADIFAVQDDVTEKIVRALEVSLADGGQGRPGRVETDNPEAYDCFLRGREQYRMYSKDSNLRARRLYEKAIELDPNYAAAHAGLAEVCLHDWFLGTPDALDRASELGLRAKALDPSLPLVYEALGSIHLFKKQHDEALDAAKRWVEVEPGSADAYANLAGFLHFIGEPEQVIPLIEKAIRLNPYYPFYYPFYRGQAYLAMERYPEALEVLQRCAAHNPESIHTQLYLAACYGLMGKEGPAREALAEVFRIHPDFSMAWVRINLPYKRAADLDRVMDGLRKAGLSE